MEAEYLKSFTIAYYKRGWVFVPLFYIPKDAYDEETGELYRMRVTLMEGQEPLKPLKRRDSRQIKEEIASTICETILPWQLPIEEVKQLCLRNDIPFRWVVGNVGNSKIHQPDPEKDEEESERATLGYKRRKRKTSILNGKEFRQFLAALKPIHKPSALIAQILWFLNNSLVDGGGFLTLQEVIRLTVDDVAPEDEEANWIRFCRSSNKKSSMIVHYLPDYLWKELCKQAKPNSWYVFSNQMGGPLLAMQIEHYFAQAGKKAKLTKRVTSASLRPVIKAQRASRTRRVRRGDFSPRVVTDKEWSQINPIISSSRSLVGKKSTHDPRAVLNAILYHLTTDCPIRKLPKGNPSWKVVDSRYRAWKKNGVMQSIERILDMKSSQESVNELR